MKPKLNLLALMQKGISCRSLTLNMALNPSSPPWNRVVTVSSYGGCFSSVGSGKMVKVDGKMDVVKYRTILEENLLQSTKKLRLAQRFTFQQVNNSKHTARVTGTFFWDQSILICYPKPKSKCESVEWIEIWYSQVFPFNLTELKFFCKKERTNISVFRCAKLEETYSKRHATVTAAKWDSTKSWLGVGEWILAYSRDEYFVVLIIFCLQRTMHFVLIKC